MSLAVSESGSSPKTWHHVDMPPAEAALRPLDEELPASAPPAPFRSPAMSQTDSLTELAESAPALLQDAEQYVVPVSAPASRDIGAGSEASSACSNHSCVVSAPMVEGEHRCFLKGTLIKTPDGALIPVEQLREGSRVFFRAQSSLEVVGLTIHEPKQEDVVFVKTANAQLMVSAKHRMVISLEPRLRFELAEKLRKGDSIAISDRALRKLEDVQHATTEAEMVEVMFQPDEPVETFLPPTAGVLTLGQRRRPATRRSGVNRRQNNDQTS